MRDPTKHSWSTLYQAAIAFKRAAPWEWMGNDDLFAVENPDDGEMGYCSILGSGGEEFGLGMFVGEDGYDRYARLMAGEAEPEGLEENMMVRGISMLFVDRDTLQKRDRDVIRSLGLRFRGRNAWPFFRSQRPGYAPWFLEKAEVLFLTAAIQQALVVADEVRDGGVDPSEGEAGDLILTRFRRGARWQEEWREAPKVDLKGEADTDSIDPVREAELRMLQNRSGALGGRWELDIFALPMPIGERSERPHFPLCFLAVETEQGLIVGTNLTEPWRTFSQKQDEVILMLTKADQVPLEVRVKSDKVRRIVEPITSILGIRVRVTSLPMVEQAKASLYEYFSG